MKKTLTINISGSIFHIDEDAYEQLQSYLHSLTSHYGTNEEGKEILSDIESRIAEIFNEKLSSKEEVVNIDMVENTIDIMGRPEEIFENDDDSHEEATSFSSEKKQKRRLYRDPEKRVFGGVCSGLASYLGIDVVVIRLLFALFVFIGYGTSFLLYFILWIAVPKALTTSQRLEMKGKKVNISNIEETIKEEYNEVKDNFNRMKDKSSPHVRDTFDKGVDFIGSTLRLLLKIFVIIAGIGFIVAGLISLIGFVSSMIFAHSVLPSFIDMSLPGTILPQIFFDGTNVTLFTIGIIMIVGIPIALLIFAGSKLIFRYKTNNKLIGLSALALWIIGIFVVVSLGITQARNYSKKSSNVTETTALKTFQNDTLYLSCSDNIDYDWRVNNIHLNDMKIVVVNDDEVLIGEPTLDIERSFSDEFEIKIRKKALGKSTKNANENTEDIIYSWEQDGENLNFNQYFTLKEDNAWRNQKLHITVKVPIGKVVYLDQSMKKIIHDIDNVSNTWDYDMLNQKWIMKKEGLTLVQ
jgi:phage shock protein PspC (stress-responsive transcriptional regulator)